MGRSCLEFTQQNPDWRTVLCLCSPALPAGYCLFFRIFSSVRMKWARASARFEAFGREPVRRRLAKCDAGSFVGTSSISFASARARKLIHFAAPPLKIAIALLDCDFVFFAHVGATLVFAMPSRTHSLSGQKAAHDGDTRLTARCRRSAHPQGRSCRLFSRAENRHDRHV